MKTKRGASNSRQGFTIGELLWAVTAVSIFSTVGITAITRQNTTAKELMLQQQIKSLNASLQTYQVSGGDLSTVTSAGGALDKLKTAAHTDQRDQFVGIRNSLVDPRLVAVPLPTSLTQTDTPRAIWDSQMKRFTFARSGTAGVVAFEVDQTAVETAPVDETRKLTTQYAANDSWVWDYTDRESDDSEVTGSDASSNSSLNDVPTTTPPSTPDSPSELLPPSFSISSGSWIYPEYPIALELINDNPEGSSGIWYSVNEGPWTLYQGELSVGPDSEIVAYAQTIDPIAYTNSGEASETYELTPQLFQGSALGEFTNAEGNYNMTVTYDEEGNAATFSWGVGANGSDPSSLQFIGNDFTAYGNATRFALGTLNFFNGTIYSSTGANDVDLSLEITFTVPETEESFIFNLGLENTRNYGYSADADADFVRIETPQSNFSTSLDGVTYALGLEFGYEGPDGFSTVDEFHVHEGSSATAEVYGVFVAVGLDEEGADTTTP